MSTYGEGDANRVILLKSYDDGTTWVPITDLAAEIAQALIDGGFGGTTTGRLLINAGGDRLLVGAGTDVLLIT